MGGRKKKRGEWGKGGVGGQEEGGGAGEGEGQERQEEEGQERGGRIKRDACAGVQTEFH